MLTEISLKDFSSFQIGGRSEFFKVRTKKDLKYILSFAKKNKKKLFFLGKGTNMLFDDRGYFGIIVQSGVNFCKIYKNKITVGSGFSFSHLGRIAIKNNLSGLEFSIGIPGSVGGAVYMNAGAFLKDTFSTLEKVRFIKENGDEKIFYKEDLEHGYRYSSFQKMKGFIFSATFLLKKKSFIDLGFIERRKKTQPIGKSIGSIFKNPKNRSAGELIEKCELKGKKIGDAKISDIHANFILNEKNATSKDVLKLISLIKIEVWKKYKIKLKEEFCFLPYRS